MQFLKSVVLLVLAITLAVSAVVLAALQVLVDSDVEAGAR